MINGIELLATAGKRLGIVETICVRVDEFFGTMSPIDAQPWLRRMVFFDDHRDPNWPQDATPPGRVFDFIAFTDDRIWYPSSFDGVISLGWKSRGAYAWMQAQSEYEPLLIEINGSSRRVWRNGRPE